MGALVESSTDLKSSHLPMERPQALSISPQNVILCFVPIMKMKIKEIGCKNICEERILYTFICILWFFYRILNNYSSNPNGL